MDMPLYSPAQSACFTGHRKLSEADLRSAVEAMTATIPHLVSKGIVHYYAGGAIGFDLAAAVTVLNLKSTIPQLSLTLALPCHNHMEQWRRIDRELFGRVMERADRVVYVNDSYFRGCMQARNRALVDMSSVLICYKNRNSGGTAYTVNYAVKEGTKVINLAEDYCQESLNI